jgi:hypothetical protein
MGPVGAGFDGVSAIGDPVQQRFTEAGIRNHLSPLGERQIGSHDDGGLLSSLSDDLEEELGPEIGATRTEYPALFLGQGVSTRCSWAHLRADRRICPKQTPN